MVLKTHFSGLSLENLSLENYSIGYSRHKNKYNLIGISNHIGV